MLEFYTMNDGKGGADEIYETYTEIHGYNILCPICFSEVKPYISLECWWDDVLGKNPQDLLDMPCKCKISIEDFSKRCIEIDELISKPISMLNKKGYRTRFCCSGHLRGKGTGYVMFDKYYEAIDKRVMDSEMFKCLNVETIKGENDQLTIRMREKLPHKSRFDSILLFRKILFKLARELEPIK